MRCVFIASNFGNTWATETHVARELQLLGHDVHKIHERQPLDWIERVCSDADVVFHMKCHGLPPDAIGMWERLAARGVKTCSYHLDLYYGLARQHEIGLDPMWRTEFVFTADGDPDAQQHFERLEINHRWMPAAMVSDETGRGTRKPQYVGPDVVFVGKTHGYHPEWPFREQMCRALGDGFGRRFMPYTHADKMWDRDLNDLFASVPVVVGDSLTLPGHVNYWSNRIYETVGRGGFLVFPQVPGITAHFPYNADRSSVLYYEPGNIDDMLGMVATAIELSDGTTLTRERCIDNGLEIVAGAHSYRHRVLSMLETMGVA